MKSPKTSRKPAVAIVAPYFPPAVGGLERYAERLARAISETDDLSVVVLTSNPNGRRTEVDTGGPYTIVRLGTWLTMSHTPVGPLWPLEISDQLRRHGVALVHAHAPVPYIADVACLVAGHRPVVFTYHSGSMAKGRQPLDTFISAYESAVLPRLFRRSSAVVAVSGKSLAARWPGRYMIYPGVDTDIFVPRPTGGVVEGPRILYVGSMARSSTWKGVNILLDAFTLVRRSIGTARLELVGPGDATSRYADQAARLGVLDAVDFRGSLGGEDLVKAYQRATVVVLPSTSQAESFGMCLVEAMSCGKPVVASRIGGIPEVVEHGTEGLLFTPGDVGELADACRRLLVEHDLAQRLGENGRQKTKERFAWPDRVAEYLALYRRLVGLRAPDRQRHRTGV